MERRFGADVQATVEVEASFGIRPRPFACLPQVRKAAGDHGKGRFGF